MERDFLPISRADMKRRGWDQCDFVYVIGDAYVDHPTFGHAIISRVLESAGGAEVLLEKDCSGQAMFQAACGILHDTERRKQMETAMASLGIRDATERIYQTVLEICQEP